MISLSLPLSMSSLILLSLLVPLRRVSDCVAGWEFGPLAGKSVLSGSFKASHRDFFPDLNVHFVWLRAVSWLSRRQDA